MKKLAIIAGISFAMCMWAPALESMNRADLLKQQREREMYWRNCGHFCSKVLFNFAVASLLHRSNNSTIPWYSQLTMDSDLVQIAGGGSLLSATMQWVAAGELTLYDVFGTFGAWGVSAFFNSGPMIRDGAVATGVILSCLSQWPSHDYLLGSAKERARRGQIIGATRSYRDWGRSCYKALLWFGVAARTSSTLGKIATEGDCSPLTGHPSEGYAVMFGDAATRLWGVCSTYLFSTWSPFVYMAGASFLSTALDPGMKIGSAATLMGLCMVGLVEGMPMFFDPSRLRIERLEAELITAVLLRDSYILSKKISELRLYNPGFDISTIKFEGESLLHLAVRQQHNPELTKILIREGHDIEVCNSQGLTPVEVATEEDNLDAVNILSPKIYGTSRTGGTTSTQS